MRLIQFLIILILFHLSLLSSAQDLTNFTQFFLNPYSLNPSYAGLEGKGSLTLSYKKQWSGIEGSPTLANVNFHTPLKAGLNFGLNIANDKRGIISNSGILFSLAYSISFDDFKFIRFGLSAGSSWNTIDLQKLSNLGSDPLVVGLLNQHAALIGNAGVSLHLKSFHFGIVLPNLFSPSFVSKDPFSITAVKPFQAVLIHASNRFYFGQDKYIFEPYVVYRINNGLPTQYEVAGVFHINNMIWAGGSFKQEFGISGFGGIRIGSSLAIGGSYTLKNAGDNNLNFPSYEVHLNYLLGQSKNKIKPKSKQPDLPLYSFIDTEKQKIKKPPVKTSTQLALDKKKQQEELARKKAEELAKAEEEKFRIREEKFKAEEERLKKEEELRHAEEDRIATKLLEEHADAQVVHHPDSATQPVVAERHEIIKKGNHAQELEIGNYIIGGVFGSPANAKKYADGLKNLGFDAKFGHLTIKNLWYVYVHKGDDINNARFARDEFRKFKILQNCWLLTVED